MNERRPTPTAERNRPNSPHSAPLTTPPTAEPPSDTAGPTDPPPHRYQVITCVMGVITCAYLTAREVLELNVEDVDFHLDRVFGRISIRRPDGSVRKPLADIPGLGPEVGIPLLDDILWAGGEFLTTEQLNGKLESIRGTDLQAHRARAQQVRRLRRAFGDSVDVEWFFIVRKRPWRIAWNVARSWRIVEHR
jgi:hypothetical protein